MANILIVEDERHLADGVAFNLRADGHTPTIVADGEAALQFMESGQGPSIDALLLDVMLPGMDGFAVARKLREDGNHVPILMLTARGRSEDVLEGFDAGADDYLPKPFELGILMARVKGLLRRRLWMSQRAEGLSAVDQAKPDEAAPPADTYSFDGMTADFNALELRSEQATHRLTVMEMELLRYLVRNEGKVVSRKAILEEVWDLHEDTDTRAIDNFIARLRKHVEVEPSAPKHLITIRGVGYKFLA